MPLDTKSNAAPEFPVHKPEIPAWDQSSGWTQTRVEAMRSDKLWFKFSLSRCTLPCS
jgi:hypothetical protein